MSDVSKQLEKMVLGEILFLDNFEEQIDAVAELRAGDFTTPIYKKLFDTFNLILSEGQVVDLMKLFDYAKELKDEIGKLAEDISSAALLSQHISQLRALTYERKVLKALDTQKQKLINAKSFIDFEKAKEELIGNLSAVSLNNESKLLDFEKFDELLFHNITMRKQNVLDGYSFGISDLDTYTNGLQRSKFYVLGGLKKSGKTRFAIYLIKTLYQQDVKTAFLSLEVPEYDLFKLLKSAFTEIDDQRLRAGAYKYFNSDELKKLKETNFDSEKLLIECNAGLNIGEVIGRLRRFAKMGVEVVFIDFLQRIKTDIKNRVNELESMTQLIADASRKLNIGIFLLSQLSNIAEREVPSILHLKGSGGIGEAADTIMVMDNLFRRTGRDSDRNLISLEIVQRYGESGKIKIYSDLSICKFSNYSERNVEQNAEFFKDEELPI